MKKTVIAVVLMLPFAASSALAQERAGAAALGALSGAVVLGPIGAVAGAVVGYTAGPSISRSWGMNRSAQRHQKRSVTTSRAAASSRGPSKQAAQKAGPADLSRVALGAAPQRSSAPTTKATEPPGQAAAGAPPVQGFE